MTDTGVPFYPQTVPSGSVVGRLATGAGPTEAILMADLITELGNSIVVTAAAQAAALKGTSATSITPSVSTLVFTTQASKNFDGQFITAYSSGSGAYAFGLCSYSGTTLTMTAEAVSGSGAHTDWVLSVAGARGATGAQGTMNSTDFPLLASIEAVKATTGMVANTGSNTAAMRTITGTSNLITVTNGNGVSGDPTLTVGANVMRMDSDNTLASGVALKNTSTNLGTLSAGTHQLSLDDGPMQRVTLSAGAHTIAVPTSGEGKMILEVTNGGAITLSITGGTKVFTGTATGTLITASGKVNWLYIERLNAHITTQYMNIA